MQVTVFPTMLHDFCGVVKHVFVPDHNTKILLSQKIFIEFKLNKEYMSYKHNKLKYLFAVSKLGKKKKKHYLHSTTYPSSSFLTSSSLSTFSSLFVPEESSTVKP
ncbi:unnamed protein product [Brugia pahangi]|uniref:Ovule protein n=1 Tax=Brugia pahangi TaxID=6280 RepID=A0A0N4TDD8_BRUPA|nr:unnamed protein product [Brugia pahangi]